MSDYWSAAPADSILAAHCRPNGNSAPPFKRQLWTKYIAPRGRGSHTTDRAVWTYCRVSGALLRSRETRNKKLRCAAIVPNYGHHVAYAHGRIDGSIESAHRDVPVRRQSRRVGLQIRTEPPFSRGLFFVRARDHLSAPSRRCQHLRQRTGAGRLSLAFGSKPESGMAQRWMRSAKKLVESAEART